MSTRTATHRTRPRTAARPRRTAPRRRRVVRRRLAFLLAVAGAGLIVALAIAPWAD
jgi:cell division septal protein FtsQ